MKTAIYYRLLITLLITSALTEISAKEVTWVAAETYSYDWEVTSFDIDENVHVTLDIGSNPNKVVPKYYVTGSSIRLYGGNTMKFSGKDILSIEFTFGPGEKTNTISADKGSFDGTKWEGEADEVTFTVSGTSGHRRIATITVTYKEEEIVIPPPVITISKEDYLMYKTVDFVVTAESNLDLYIMIPGYKDTFGMISGSYYYTLRSGSITIYAYAENAKGERSEIVEFTFSIPDLQLNGNGTEYNPLDLASVNKLIDADMVPEHEVYVKGIISDMEPVSETGTMTYYISEDGTNANALKISDGLSVSGNKFKDDPVFFIGTHQVVVCGRITKNESDETILADSHLSSVERIVPIFMSGGEFYSSAYSSDEDRVMLDFQNALVLYVNDGIYYVKCNGVVRINGDATGLEAGQLIDLKVIGSINRENDIPCFDAFARRSNLLSSGNDVVPENTTTLDFYKYNTNYKSELIKIDNVAFSGESFQGKRIRLRQDGLECVLYDIWNTVGDIQIDCSKTYSVTGIVLSLSDTYTIAPRSSADIQLIGDDASDYVPESDITKIHAIRSNGNQSVNTHYIHTRDTRVELDCKVSRGSQNNYSALFGSYPIYLRDHTFAFFSRYANDDDCTYIFSGNSHQLDDIYDQRVLLSCDASVASVFKNADKSILLHEYVNQSNVETGLSWMALFAANTNELKYGFVEDHLSWMTFYGCKIYESDALVRDYIPAKYNNEYGIYDRVSHTFEKSTFHSPFIGVRNKADVNDDCFVDISDIVAVINQIAGSNHYENADVNEDNNVDISDIVMIINCIAGEVADMDDDIAGKPQCSNFYPQDGGELSNSEVNASFTFWAHKTGDYNLTIKLCSDPDMTQLIGSYQSVANIKTEDSQTSIPIYFGNLESNQPYYWCVYLTDGDELVPYSPVMSFKIVVENICPDDNHPHVIDLGIGVKFACCNVGAQNPWQAGGYYSWGMTETSDSYDLLSYKYYSTYQDLDSNISGTSYDVAHVKWQSNWQMPTVSDIQALMTLPHERYVLNGILGYMFEGENGAKLYFPGAGTINSSTTTVGSLGIGCYWTSEKSEMNLCPYYFFIDQEQVKIRESTCSNGECVRPVFK